jgi:hypothetical protein
MKEDNENSASVAETAEKGAGAGKFFLFLLAFVVILVIGGIIVAKYM